MTQTSSRIAETRARRRTLGLRSTEAVLHEAEIAVLDGIRDRLGLTSRSDAIRVVLSKVDPSTITPADAAALTKRAG